jgi:hypothetical protein
LSYKYNKENKLWGDNHKSPYDNQENKISVINTSAKCSHIHILLRNYGNGMPFEPKLTSNDDLCSLSKRIM